MYIKRLHKILGLVMLVPLLLWAITGFIFLTKPGYGDAYKQLQPKLYPINQTININASAWTEVKIYRTVLGEHLLVNDQGEWRHLRHTDLHEQAFPSEQKISLLINDAISKNKDRYGNIHRIEGQKIYTDTGVVITLDWPTLSLKQEGKDTRLINMLYKIHYLQWLDSPSLNQLLGFTGLALLILLSAMGLTLLLKR